MKKWYEEGLRFKCTGCGKCCSGFPGYVWLTEEDITRFTEHLKISREEFVKKYTRKVGSSLSLIEKKNYDCIFYEDKKCLAYGARPKQCQTFPFWTSNLASKEAWLEEKQGCEGIDHPEAPLISFREIEERKE